MRRRTKKLIQAALCATALTLPFSGAAEEKETSPSAVQSAFTVFDAPAMSRMLSVVFGALGAGRFDDAEKGMREIIGRYPDQPQNYYLLATILSTRNNIKGSLEALSLAIDKGFGNAGMLQKDPNLKAARVDPTFQELAEKIIQKQATAPRGDGHRTAPSPLRDGTALVSLDNTLWVPRFHVLLSRFDVDRQEPRSAKVQFGNSPVTEQLNVWFQQGKAAGNSGDLYDNRDRQHSTLWPDDYPQLSFIRYGEEAMRSSIDYGLNDVILYNAVTFGNSSTAITTGPFWRSQARLGLTQPSGIGKLFLQYIRNHLYIYPAVTDYGETHGDVLTANTPYVIISDGKSGSDLPFLNAIASILAAFRPDVKDYLKAQNLIVPTVQMIFRAGQKPVHGAEDYLTYKAHPPVFSNRNIDLFKMIKLAQNLEIPNIPSMVELEVIGESVSRKGIDDFSSFRTETLHDTPGAITRAIHSTAYGKAITISAEKTKVPEGQTLTYHWVVLRGDAERITISPKNETGSIVEITVPWHDPFYAPERPDIKSNRVEIGAFVHNGHHYSAPAFVNFLFPANQRREYNANSQIVLIDHNDPGIQSRYADPQIFMRRSWKDEYRYDKDGNLLGWRRSIGGRSEEFTRDGARISERDTYGRPVVAEIMRYVVAKDSEGLPVMEPQGTNQFLQYEYMDATDRIGSSRPK